MEEKKLKRNDWAIIGMILGALSSFVINTPLVPILPAAALIASIVGIYEASKTKSGLAYAIVGFTLSIIVFVVYFM